MTSESQEEALTRIKSDRTARRDRYIEALRQRDVPAKFAVATDLAFLTTDELHQFGFGKVGRHVQVSRKCSLYGIKGSLGDHVRVDDYCTLKGNVVIESYVHIAGYVLISGFGGRVTFKAFSSAAARATILATSDDHRANSLSNSCVPKEYLTSICGPITIGVGTLVGAHCVVLPNVNIGDGASIGSGCVVYRNVPDGGVLRMAAAQLQPQRRDHQAITALAAQVLAAGD